MNKKSFHKYMLKEENNSNLLALLKKQTNIQKKRNRWVPLIDFVLQKGMNLSRKKRQEIIFSF